jgi:hypothetical protein
MNINKYKECYILWVIPQMKEYNIHNTVKVWNQEI